MDQPNKLGTSTEEINYFQLLAAEEYAERIGVSRTTVFEWKRRGILVEGRHYIKIGKILRFFWGINTLKDIAALNNNVLTSKKKTTRHSISKPSGPNRINFDY